MNIFILTGPAGAGKNTVANIFAKKRAVCAVVDVDVVRHMFVQPHTAPWSGEEGRRQQMLGVENTTALANNFVKNGCDVLILDVLTTETLSLYKTLLNGHFLKIILLLPTLEEVKRRNTLKPASITEEEIVALYKSQESLEGYDQKIDTTELSAEVVAEKLNMLMR